MDGSEDVVVLGAPGYRRRQPAKRPKLDPFVGIIDQILEFGRDFQVHDRREWRQQIIHDKAQAPASVSEADHRSTPFGAVDMLGNVWEWCSSPLMYPPFLLALGRDPEYTGQTKPQELRGGSYLDDLTQTPAFASVSDIPKRHECRHSDLGFRVAAIVPMRLLPPEVAERVAAGYEVSLFEDRQRFDLAISNSTVKK